MNSSGVLPVAIAGTTDLDVSNIDPVSVRLEGVAPIRSNIEDVATRLFPLAGKTDCSFDCAALRADGFQDLALHFDTQEILEALGSVEHGDCRVLKLAATLRDGTPIAGEDVVVILKNRH